MGSVFRTKTNFIWETVSRRSSTSSLGLYLFSIYENSENVLSHKHVVSNVKRTFIASAAAHNCEYSFASEIQNLAQVLLDSIKSVP